MPGDFLRPQGAERQKDEIMKSTAKVLILFTLIAALTACGGGGDGGAAAPATSANLNTNTSAASATPTPAPEPATVVTAAVAASYAAGTEEANTFALLNAERQKCGFGSLVQSTQLDQAAAAHASYLVTNNLGYGHYEAGGLPGFTGTTEQDRATAAGYPNPVGADLATSSGPVSAAGTLRTTRFVRGLLASPYHLLSMVGDSFADVGIGYSRKTSGATEIQALNITLGRRAGINDLAADQIYSYPCDGSAGVNPGLANETPSPIPLNLTQSYKLYGTPVAVKVRVGKALAVTSVTITPSIGGPAVPVQIVTTANDPQGGALMRPDSAYVLPLAPLQAGKSYTVNLAGAIDSVPYTKSFSFTTGL